MASKTGGAKLIIYYLTIFFKLIGLKYILKVIFLKQQFSKFILKNVGAEKII